VADEGYSADQVAVLAGVGRPTVNTWVRRYAQAGLDGLVDRPKPGKPAQVSGQYSASYTRAPHAPGRRMPDLPNRFPPTETP
jgi:transposase